MQRLRRRAALLTEVLLAYAQVARARRERDLPTTLQALRRPQPAEGHGVAPAQLHEALRVGRATSRTLRLLPVDSRCLTCSLVVSRLLARRGIPGRLVIGVLPAKTFTAHAWVEVESTPVLFPGPEDTHRLTEL